MTYCLVGKINSHKKAFLLLLDAIEEKAKLFAEKEEGR